MQKEMIDKHTGRSVMVVDYEEAKHLKAASLDANKYGEECLLIKHPDGTGGILMEDGDYLVVDVQAPPRMRYNTYGWHSLNHNFSEK